MFKRHHTTRAVGMAAVLLPVALLAIAVTRPTTGHAATAPTYQFDLNPPNTAVSPNGGIMAAPGDWIRVTGSGSFTPATGKITASGSFIHYSADGTVHCKGTWKATALNSFTDFGSDANGDEGGIISMTASHTCRVMGSHTGIPMTVTSTINAPSGTVEGTTVAEFTQPTGGGVTIQQQ